MDALKIAGIILLVLVLIIIAFVLYGRHRINHPPDRGHLEATIDRQIAKILAREQSYGLVIGIFKQGASFIKGYGSALKDSDVPPDSSSIFELASVSKLFTTTLLQLLCDRKIVQPDDRIADLLREHVTLPAAAANTTLRQLATHTSGFPPLPQSFITKMHDVNNPYKDLQLQDLYDYLQTCEGKKPEGGFEYSNFGMGLLGHILALKTGLGYEQAVQRELLQPLGMEHTFVTTDECFAGNIVQGYSEAGKPTPVWTDAVLTGAGSFLSNASDMLLFLRANLDTKHPLHPMLAKTHLPQPGNIPAALGWMLPDNFDKFAGNKTVLWHNGMAGGYASYIGIDPATGNGIILLSNKAEDITSQGSILMRMVNTQSWKR